MPAVLPNYGCTGRETPGSEVTYRFDCPITGQATFHLVPQEADLDLIVLGVDSSGGCDVLGQCLGASRQDGLLPEEVTLQVDAGGRGGSPLPRAHFWT